MKVKKLVSILLTVALCVQILTFPTSAESDSSEEFGFSLPYVGTYNDKLYFYTRYDLFCFDKDKDTFTRLRRPADVVVPPVPDPYQNRNVIRKVDIIERNGKAYLRWEISMGYDATDKPIPSIIRTREIK